MSNMILDMEKILAKQDPAGHYRRALGLLARGSAACKDMIDEIATRRILSRDASLFQLAQYVNEAEYILDQLGELKDKVESESITI